MKSKIFNIISNFYRKDWGKCDSIKIIIQTNKYFSKTSWENNLNEHFTYLNNSEIIFTNNKFHIVHLIKEADFCFLWGLSTYINLNQSKVKLLYFGTVGLDFLSKKSIPSHILVKNPRGISSEAIAEYSLAIALLLNRKLHIAIRNQTKSKWAQSEFLKEAYDPIKNKSIGIIGLGNNGLQIANYFKSLGCTVYGLDEVIADYSFVDKFFASNQLHEFLKSINILILSLPLTEKSKNLINGSTISYLGKNSIIINVSRSEIINENDLISAIKLNKIKYAALDVFDKEPLSYFDKKWFNSKLILTPHIAGNINLFVDKIQKDFINELNNLSKNYV